MSQWDSVAPIICRQLNVATKPGDQAGSILLADTGVAKECELMIERWFAFNEAILDPGRSHVVHRATITARNAGEVTPQSLRAAIRREEQAYLRKPVDRYYLLTSLSVSRSVRTKLKRVRIGDCTISFPGSIKRKNQSWIEDCYSNSFRQLREGSYPIDYLVLRVSTLGRTPLEAGDRAIRAADILRGVWNLVIGMRSRMTIGGSPSPVNEILPGPIQALFRHTDSEPPGSLWWYEPVFRGWKKSALFERNADRVPRLQSFILDGCRRYTSGDLFDLVARYGQALDTPDLQDSMLKLWSVLEGATTGHEKGASNKVVSRASAIFEGRDEVEWLLRTIGEARNQHVHLQRGLDDPEPGLYGLKEIVRRVLQFHITNSFQFRSFEEACEFLDTLRVQDLERQMWMYKNARRFLSSESS